MACLYGNCNDANCANGSDTDVNGNPCDDAGCAPCGSIAVTGGVAASTVSPNPSVYSAGISSSASQMSQVGSVMGQWGATIAGIVTGTPTVVTARGAATGAAAVSPSQSLFGSTGSGSGILLLGIAAVVVLLLVTRK